MKLPLIFFLLLSLGACSTQADYERTLQGWVGVSEGQLVRQWGAPHRAYDAGGARYLTFVSGSSGMLPGSPPAYYSTGSVAIPSGGLGPMMVNLWCETTFEVRNGAVASWQYQGNHCH